MDKKLIELDATIFIWYMLQYDPKIDDIPTRRTWRSDSEYLEKQLGLSGNALLKSLDTRDQYRSINRKSTKCISDHPEKITIWSKAMKVREIMTKYYESRYVFECERDWTERLNSVLYGEITSSWYRKHHEYSGERENVTNGTCSKEYERIMVDLWRTIRRNIPLNY